MGLSAGLALPRFWVSGWRGIDKGRKVWGPWRERERERGAQRMGAEVVTGNRGSAEATEGGKQVPSVSMGGG